MKSLALIALLMVSISLFAQTNFIYATGTEYTIYLNPTSYWNENGALTDGYTKEERAFLAPILDDANLCELQESTYVPCGEESDDFFWALEILEEYGIKHSPDFQTFIDKSN